MNPLSPASLFRASFKDIAAEHAALVLTSRFNTVLTFVLAELATGKTMNPDMLMGARAAIEVIRNIAEIPEPSKPAPPDKFLGQKPPEKK